MTNSTETDLRRIELELRSIRMNNDFPQEAEADLQDAEQTIARARQTMVRAQRRH